MDFLNVVFRRKFSITMYKDLKLALRRMAFTKDFANDKRGDLYPVLEKSACEGIQRKLRFFFCYFGSRGKCDLGWQFF